ncbi:MAG: phosphonoacetaldehyde hydrolase [Clostridiales bacterium]|nr:phosphonoacetaldehyde hydrolase [Clostridiales bacterium]
MRYELKAVILDWAGTTVDYGSMAPVRAFEEAFRSVGVVPEEREIRAFMGLPKLDHVAAMLGLERLGSQFRQANGRDYTEKDINHIYGKFEPALFETLEQHAALLPGVPEAVQWLREQGIAIGSTTGYTREMMKVILPIAKTAGYSPDCLVCPDDTGGYGRPYPYMLWANLKALRIADVRTVLKVGDTKADIREAQHGGCQSAGVLLGSNMMGLSGPEEFEARTEEARAALCQAAENQYRQAGAQHIIRTMAQLPQLIASMWKE